MFFNEVSNDDDVKTTGESSPIQEEMAPFLTNEFMAIKHLDELQWESSIPSRDKRTQTNYAESLFFPLQSRSGVMLTIKLTICHIKKIC